jgi:hypothetical protein
MKYLAIILTAITLNGQVLIDHYRFGGSTENNNLLTDIVAMWEMDEASGNALDSSANARHLTQTGTVDAVGEGVLNGARGFQDNHSSHFSYTNASWNVLTNNDFTIAFWINVAADNFSDSFQSVIIKGDLSPFDQWIEWGIWVEGGSQAVYADGVDIKFFAEGIGTLEVPIPTVGNDWIFYTISRSGNDFTARAARESDAVIAFSDTLSSANAIQDADVLLVVGGAQDSSDVSGFSTDYDFSGNIDRLGMWARSFNECEIYKLFRLKPFSVFDTDACE